MTRQFMPTTAAAFTNSAAGDLEFALHSARNANDVTPEQLARLERLAADVRALGTELKNV